MRSRSLKALMFLLTPMLLFGGIQDASAFAPRRITVEDKRDANFPAVESIERNGAECVAFRFPRNFKINSFNFTIYTNERIRASRGGMEARYCERMFPPNLAAVYEGRFDAPAELLHISREDIERIGLGTRGNTELENVPDNAARTDGPDRALGQKHYRYMGGALGYLPIQLPHEKLVKAADWEAIQDLNLQAADAWDALIRCNLGDAEAARAAYARGKDLCKTGESESGQVFDRLAALHGNVQAFLESSQMLDLEGATLLKAVHPLFVQALLEVYAADRDILSQILDIYEVIEYKNLLQTVRDSVGWKNANGVSQMFSGSVASQGRRILNSKMLLQFIPANRCESWGLWPGLSRTLLHYSFVNDPTNEYLEVDVIRRKIDQVCGPQISDPFSGYCALNFWDQPIAQDFRNMVRRYGQLVWVTPASFIKKGPGETRRRE